mgnify:CR=1 FL=1
MAKINKNKILISFDKKIYTLKAIKGAVKEFKPWADFKIKQKNKKIQVEIKNLEAGIQREIKDEFCNYVLFLVIS